LLCFQVQLLSCPTIRQSSPEDKAILSFNSLVNFFCCHKISFLVFCLFSAVHHSVNQQTCRALNQPVSKMGNRAKHLHINFKHYKVKKEDLASLNLCCIAWVFCPLNWPKSLLIISYFLAGNVFLYKNSERKVFSLVATPFSHIDSLLSLTLQLYLL
jgi:hypothetical protein